jgi:hypothetical protein
MSAKRGQPRRPSGNVRLAPEDVASERARYPDGHPELDLLVDGKGLDFRLPPPPWDDYDREAMHTNLARLRVDPKSSNQVAIFETALVRTIANIEGDDWTTFYDVGKYFGELLSKWDHDTAERIFKDVLRMRRTADEPPHRNFLAYRAYCDFLLEYGFDPSMPRLTEFIESSPRKYPVGIENKAGSKDWWQMFFEAGLVRLAE